MAINKDSKNKYALMPAYIPVVTPAIDTDT